ncbi:MAG TPA: hypothetical protein VJJ79_00175 [Candidatus Nanoarchaeia archaeon]|nr:hypothetical protein [Candidatus Nanoarchaeia archaeon]
MVKKNSSPRKEKKEADEAFEHVRPGIELPKFSPEMEARVKKIQDKLDKFRAMCLEKIPNITGMSLLPPLKPRQGETVNPDEIHIFMLIDDAPTEFPKKGELILKTTEDATKIAEEIDKNFKPQVMLIAELKEACFDAKYDIIQMVASSGIFYDKGLLSALKVADFHKTMTVKKFEKYVASYIAVGSLFRGDAAPNDIDVAIVIDDTDVKKMSRLELREKLRTIILNMGYDASQQTGVRAQFHIQTYILTDFWENLRDANPVIFTMLRDGVPLYDRGIFMPWKLLLQMGRIKPSPEAIDMNMEVGDRLLERTKQKLLSVVGEDLFYAVMNPTQAALMLYGIPPPTPKEAVQLMDEIYVKKEKLLEKKYIEILEKIRKTFKDIEHGEIKEVTGADIDRLLKDCKDYLERIKQLFNEIRERQERETMFDIHTTSINLARDLLGELGVKEVTVGKLPELFKKHVCDGERLPVKYYNTLNEIIDAKKEYEKGKITKQELNKVRRDAREFIRVIMDFLDLKRTAKFDKLTIRFTYDINKTGELLLLENIAFLIRDLNQREKIEIVQVDNDGCLVDVKKSSVGEFEKYIKHVRVPPSRIIKPRTLETLKTIMGEDIGVLWKV